MTDLVSQLVEELEYLIDLADSAMRQANNDGAEYDRDEMLAAPRAALTAAKAGGWVPIETCPRDFGITNFDVWANGERYADCWWGRATYEQGDFGIVYRSGYDCNGPVDSYVKGATAWQPLPTPPKEQS